MIDLAFSHCAMRIQALTLVDQSDGGGEGRWETREVDAKLTLPKITSAALLWSDLSKDNLISGTEFAAFSPGLLLLLWLL